jgi:hypothetical protein
MRDPLIVFGFFGLSAYFAQVVLCSIELSADATSVLGFGNPFEALVTK